MRLSIETTALNPRGRPGKLPSDHLLKSRVFPGPLGRKSCYMPGIRMLILDNSPAPRRGIDAVKEALNPLLNGVNSLALPGDWGAGVSID